MSKFPSEAPLVLVPQYFGSLVFDRRTSRYFPFDRESTELLIDLAKDGLTGVLAEIDSNEQQETVQRFYDCYYEQGFFGFDERLSADILKVEVPSNHLVGPLSVHLEVIAACNLTCTHCFATPLPRNQNPLQLNELDGLFIQLAELGAFRLGLTGGEPLLRKDLFDILDAATERGLHPCLTTNALLVTRDIARQFGSRRLVWLNVSLEGPSPETNDLVRGLGTFDQVVKNLELLAEHARFTLAFTIMRTNAHLVRQCAELAYRVGAHTAVFRPLYPAGSALQHLELMPTFSQYQQAMSDLATMEIAQTDLHGLDPFGPESRALAGAEIHTSHTCSAGTHVCSISVQGDVNPCSFLGPGFNAGNIRVLPFSEIWRNSQHMQRMRQCDSPTDTEHRFHGGCRARSQTFAGSFDAPDPWFTEFERQSSDGSGNTVLHPGSNLELIQLNQDA